LDALIGGRSTSDNDSPLLSSAAALPPSTHATLQSSGPPLRALLSRSNTFVFENVPAGSYVGVVHCKDLAFEALRIDVGAARGCRRYQHGRRSKGMSGRTKGRRGGRGVVGL